MSNVAHNLSPAEIEERKLFLARLAVDFPKPSAEVVPLRRAPLGLGLAADEPRDEVDDVVEDIASPPLTRTDDRAATLLDIDYLIRHALRHERKFVFDVTGVILGECLGEMARDLRKEFGRTPETADAQASLRVEVAELKAALAEFARRGHRASARSGKHAHRQPRRKGRAWRARRSGHARTGRTGRAARRTGAKASWVYREIRRTIPPCWRRATEAAGRS